MTANQFAKLQPESPVYFILWDEQENYTIKPATVLERGQRYAKVALEDGTVATVHCSNLLDQRYDDPQPNQMTY